MYELTCTECGAKAGPVKRSDAKYCDSCRLLINLLYCIGKWKRVRKCRLCEARYRPRHGHDLSWCAACETEIRQRSKTAGSTRWGGPPVLGHCIMCLKDDVPLEKGVAVCLYCLKDPKDQEKVIKALHRGRTQRREAHPARMARLEAGGPHLKRLP